MHDVTKALLDADLGLAESVLGADASRERQQAALDELALEPLATQQPVATELTQPTRQPISRSSFDAEPTVMVRSARPSQAAGPLRKLRVG